MEVYLFFQKGRESQRSLAFQVVQIFQRKDNVRSCFTSLIWSMCGCVRRLKLAFSRVNSKNLVLELATNC